MARARKHTGATRLGQLTEQEVEAVTKHSVSHEISYCKCPCYDALLRLGQEAQRVAALADMARGYDDLDKQKGQDQDVDPLP
jgi:hypothetical protein